MLICSSQVKLCVGFIALQQAFLLIKPELSSLPIYWALEYIKESSKQNKTSLYNDGTIYLYINTKSLLKHKYRYRILSSIFKGCSILINKWAGLYTKVNGAMYEAKANLDCFIMQAMGGMAGAWDPWKRATITSLLANSGSWVGIGKDTCKTLIEVQI